MTTPPLPMPSERRSTLYLNESELVSLQTTPVALDDWAVGFLFTEGIIGSLAELLDLRWEREAASGRVWAGVAADRLGNSEFAAHRYLTSGCGKGVTFSSVKDAMLLRPVRSDCQVSREQLVAWMQAMQRQTPLYDASGGMHAAAAVHLPSGDLLVREDIGRHNAVDKAIGAALRAGWAPGSCVMLTSGRISYEMCAKFARFGAGLGVSLTAATDQAFRLATRLGIDLVGYLRRSGKMLLYTDGEHLLSDKNFSKIAPDPGHAP